eukprot:gnl/TRDRNA2_/TRDRNA2_186763_c0_seq1.p1 gnl/TRDRNA2_/TRDRNA2_186763_c0~~gnl/TRDRNA2_/TRDRNA2_186763_c0_seq1.p1  ORF type:complete len:129 (-),score=14.71 gnl/TRDRNA2_/TRDRNA2_186763_c0_seq1:45-431(-)
MGCCSSAPVESSGLRLDRLERELKSSNAGHDELKMLARFAKELRNAGHDTAASERLQQLGDLLLERLEAQIRVDLFRCGDADAISAEIRRIAHDLDALVPFSESSSSKPSTRVESLLTDVVDALSSPP